MLQSTYRRWSGDKQNYIVQGRDFGKKYIHICSSQTTQSKTQECSKKLQLIVFTGFIWTVIKGSLPYRQLS